VYKARILQKKKAAVQVPGLGLEMWGLPDLQTKMQADFSRSFPRGSDV
jgi:hypothetical protein